MEKLIGSGKSLRELSKQELISIVQDYQEMVSDIESEINRYLITFPLDSRSHLYRKIINKYVHKSA